MRRDSAADGMEPKEDVVPEPRHSRTLRLHQDDTYLCSFEARVLEARPLEAMRWEVALDRSAFYVDAGGQPSDQGTLAGLRVTGLRSEDGVTWHAVELPEGTGRLSEEAFSPDAVVRGEVDPVTRLDHMQQHTGQHILSQSFLRVGGGATESFHLGREESTVDLSGAPPAPELVAAAVEEANSCVLRDVPVRALQVERGDLGRYPLRKDPGAEREVLRLIEIEGFDWSACGGTHARRTGEVGPLHVLGVEKAKSLWRVRFLAGKRTLRYLSRAHQVLDEVARAGSIRWDQVAEAARAWREEAAAAAKEVRRLRIDRGEREGERLILDVEPDSDGVRRLGYWCGPVAPEELRALASKAVALVPALVLAGGTDGTRSFWVAARSARLPEGMGGWNAGDVLGTWLTSRDGKGGGTPLFAQGTSAAVGEAEAQELPYGLSRWLRSSTGT